MTAIDRAIELLNEYKATGEREKASEAAHMITKMLWAADGENTCCACGGPTSMRRRYCDACQRERNRGYSREYNAHKRMEGKRDRP